jgi:hypothetical protein
VGTPGEQARNEMDPKKLMELVSEINRIWVSEKKHLINRDIKGINLNLSCCRLVGRM